VFLRYYSINNIVYFRFKILTMNPIAPKSTARLQWLFRCMFLVVTVLLLTTCGPKIYEFNVIPLTIWPADSIKVTYKVRGEAVLMVNDRKINADTTYRNFTLGFPGKEGGRHLQVTILNQGGQDEVIFKDHFHGDSLVASGIKNLARWGDSFGVWKVSNPGPYDLDIMHEGHALHLNAGKTDSTTLSQTAVRGAWSFGTLLKPAQRADSTHLLPSLTILITLKHH
jgi:hypothetical protein